MSKKNDRTMKELLTELKQYPYGSVKHKEVWKLVSKRTYKQYPDQFVLSTYNKFATLKNEHLAYLSRLDAVTDFDAVDAFSPKKSFFENEKFEFVPREDAEYNFYWKQINVFCFVTDGANYLLLQKKSGSEITMIGGHVDFDITTYRVSQLEWLRSSIQKELDEEVIHHKKFSVPERPVALVNTFENFNDLFHMALVYKVVVDDLDSIFKDLRTGEPEKHDIIKFSSKEDLLKHPKLHHWIKTIEKYL
jgi:predicted NUDIX family phosphoesterase